MSGKNYWDELLSFHQTQLIDKGRTLDLPRHSQAHVLPSHAIKTRRECSPSVKLLSYHPMQSRQGEDAQPSIMDTAKSICGPWGQSHQWITLHQLSRWYVCIPGQRHHTILMPPNLPRFRTAPWSPLLWQIQEQNIYKSELDPKHAYYISYAWLL